MIRNLVNVPTHTGLSTFETSKRSEISFLRNVRKFQLIIKKEAEGRKCEAANV